MARARLAEKLEGRRRREAAELEHVTVFEAALARRTAAEAEMAAAVAGLIALGDTVAEVAGLTELTESEVRRLRKLATNGDGQTGIAAAEPAPAGPDGRRQAAALSRATLAGDGQDTLGFDTAPPPETPQP